MKMQITKSNNRNSLVPKGFSFTFMLIGALMVTLFYYGPKESGMIEEFFPSQRTEESHLEELWVEEPEPIVEATEVVTTARPVIVSTQRSVSAPQRRPVVNRRVPLPKPLESLAETPRVTNSNLRAQRVETAYARQTIEQSGNKSRLDLLVEDLMSNP